MAVPALVDQYGDPMRSHSSLGSARLMRAADSTADRPEWNISLDNINRVVPTWDWRRIVSVSRQLYANMGVPRGAIDQKAKFSIGRAWDPKFEGGVGDAAAREWGKRATEWLRDEWFGICNVRGAMYDFKTDLHLASIAVDRDGDFGILLTESEDGYPMLQHIPAHRIGQRNFGANTLVNVKDAKSYLPGGEVIQGLYEGLPIENGVIYNSIGRPVAYRILGATGADDIDVSARDFIHVYDPEWADQGRGFPAFTHACNDFRDMLQSQQWEQLAQLICSSLGLQEWNDTGTAGDPTDLAFDSAPAIGPEERTITRQYIQGGKISVFKGNGGKIDSFASQRPSAMWNEFWDRLTRSALAGINWPYSMAWKPLDAGAAQMRGELLKAQAAVDDRQDLLRGPAARCVRYAVSKAIKRGDLPPYPGKDKAGFLKWGFAMPPKLSVDRGRDGDARREDYKLGHRNLTEILAEDGATLETHRDLRERELVDVIERAKRISERTGISLEVAISMFEQRSPNPVQPTPQMPEPNGPEPEPEPEET